MSRSSVSSSVAWRRSDAGHVPPEPWQRPAYQSSGHAAVRSAGGIALLMSKLVSTAAKYAGQRDNLSRRRSEVRYSTELQVRYLTEPPGHSGLPKSGARLQTAHLFDLSYTGAGLLTTGASMREGERVWLSLQSFGYDGLWVQGKVVNVCELINGVHRIGISLELED